MKPEQKFKQKIKKYFEVKGAIVNFIESPFAPGFPDICIFYKDWELIGPNTKVIFIEAKIINSENCKIKFEMNQQALYRKMYKSRLYPSIQIWVHIKKEKKIYLCTFNWFVIHELFDKKFNEIKQYFYEVKLS